MHDALIKEKRKKMFDIDVYLVWANSVVCNIFKFLFEFGTKLSQFYPAECRNFSSSGVKLFCKIYPWECPKIDINLIGILTRLKLILRHLFGNKEDNFNFKTLKNKTSFTVSLTVSPLQFTFTIFFSVEKLSWAKK